MNTFVSRLVAVLAAAGAAFGFLDAFIFQSSPSHRMAPMTLALICLLVLGLNHIDDKRNGDDARRKGAYRARHGL